MAKDEDSPSECQRPQNGLRNGGNEMPYAIKLDLKGRAEKVQKPNGMSMLDFIYQECDCSIFEVVHAKGLRPGFFLAIDEEGLLKETPFINPCAS